MVCGYKNRIVLRVQILQTHAPELLDSLLRRMRLENLYYLPADADAAPLKNMMVR